MKNALAEMNARSVKEAVSERSVAVVIFGACENHGDHMPYGSDFIMPLELATRLAQKRKEIIILPPVPYGVSSHHKDFFMTISLESETMVGVIRDVLQSIIDNKISHILIINGHDGNIGPLEVASRTIKERNPQAVVACLESWWTLVGKLEPELFDVWEGLGHGGEGETSAMLAARPDLVDMALAPPDVVPKLPKNIRLYWKFSELTNTSATGSPRNATVDKGEKMMGVLERVLVNFLEEMDGTGWKYGKSL